MTPITQANIGPFRRVQQCPCSSMTFENPDFMPINLTMTRNNIKYYEANEIKIMSPVSLLAWYEDEPDIHQEKIAALRHIIELTRDFEFKSLYAKEPRQLNGDLPSSKRRLVLL